MFLMKVPVYFLSYRFYNYLIERDTFDENKRCDVRKEYVCLKCRHVREQHMAPGVNEIFFVALGFAIEYVAPCVVALFSLICMRFRSLFFLFLLLFVLMWSSDNALANFFLSIADSITPVIYFVVRPLSREK
jgi:hypothetical protein